MDKISIKVDISIAKPVEEVFGAVLKPAPFFIAGASGVLREGAKIKWKFEGDPEGFEVFVRKIVPERMIQFEWPQGKGGHNIVEFKFSEFKDDITTVSVSESGWDADKAGRDDSYRNTGGWMHMLCCLKAHLEHGINLRKGSFIHKNIG
jgi:uncharacterized protein YndB with AHSA1/START domain